MSVARAGEAFQVSTSAGPRDSRLPEPFDDRMGQEDAGFGFAVRGMLHRKIRRRIDQHLARELRPVAVARGERNHGGEIAAALSPPTVSRAASMPSPFALAATHWSLPSRQSTAAGNLCSGAKR